MSIRLEDTPILEQLVKQAEVETLSLHMPGHHQGRDFPEIFSEWLGACPKLDGTELPGLDNLHHPEGCILASERLTADYYGSRNCFFSVNGSTAGVMAAISACASETKKILFLNPFHLSAWRGLVLSGAMPAFLQFEWDPLEYTFVAPNPDRLAKRLAREANYSAIYLTSPTYHGRVADVWRIVELAHQYEIPVIVDEAHGAHLGLTSEFPDHSVHAGADIVIQSAHKVLPSFTQTAWVHVQGRFIDPERVKYHLNFLQTTSPSYLLLASLDVAQAWLRKEGPIIAHRFMVNQSAVFPVHSNSYLADPLRQWIPIGDATASKRLASMLKERGIYVEIADMTGILAMFGFSMTQKHFERYAEVVEMWRGTFHGPRIDSPAVIQLLSHATDLSIECSPRTAELAQKTVVSLKQSVGQICGTLITPYPPGIPILWPGQRIEKEMVDGIFSWLASGCSLNGLESNAKINILL